MDIVKERFPTRCANEKLLFYSIGYTFVNIMVLVSYVIITIILMVFMLN